VPPVHRDRAPPVHRDREGPRSLPGVDRSWKARSRSTNEARVRPPADPARVVGSAPRARDAPCGSQKIKPPRSLPGVDRSWKARSRSTNEARVRPPADPARVVGSAEVSRDATSEPQKQTPPCSQQTNRALCYATCRCCCVSNRGNIARSWAASPSRRTRSAARRIESNRTALCRSRRRSARIDSSRQACPQYDDS